MSTFTPLPAADLEQMIQGATLVEQDSFGPKVYLLANGDYLKLFRRKRWLSSALLCPHSRRFLANAAALGKLGVPTLEPRQLFRLDKAGWTAVTYRPLPGQTLNQLLKSGEESWESLVQPLARFINQLHLQGIYFRSLHLGNIVRTPEGTLGLIDIADMRVRRAPLGRSLVRRNREHFDKYIRKEKLPYRSETLWALCDELSPT